jgi:hypothetical protein
MAFLLEGSANVKRLNEKPAKGIVLSSSNLICYFSDPSVSIPVPS